MNIKVSMEKIQRYNCAGLCQEEFCSSKYTNYANCTINGLKIHLAFCDKHSEEFEKNGWEALE